MKFKEKMFDAIKGFFIGFAFLIPGVSGGTVALVTKVYDKMTKAIANLFKNFIPNFLTLLPIGIGVLIAMVGMWYPLHKATEYIPLAMVSLFAGCVIGSLPDVISNVKNDKLLKRHYLYLVIAILIGAAFGVLSANSKMIGIDVSSLFSPIDFKIFLIITPIGFLASTGIVVPGISGSMFLLVIGFYKPILGLIENFKTPNLILPSLGILICMAIGVILGMIVFSKIMRILFNKFNTATYIWIIGLVVGSIFSLFYNNDLVEHYQKGIEIYEWILASILLIGGFILSYSLVRYSRKHKKDNNTLNETR